jgi:hypothetical protein
MAKFQKGDVVTCDYSGYQMYGIGSKAKVLDVVISSNGNELITLKNDLTEYGSTDYLARNFSLVHRPKKKEEPMADYNQKTFYFAMRRTESDQLEFFQSTRTPLREQKSQAIQDAKQSMQEGEEWMVLQAVAMLKHEEPKPPIIITEYR